MSRFRSRKSQLTPLSEALGKSLRDGFLNFTAQKLRIFEIWPRVVGPEAARFTKAEMIHNGRLTVLVPGPAWLDLYNYQKKAWLARLNAELGGGVEVDEIVLQVGEFEA